MTKLVFSSPFLRLYPNSKKATVHSVAVKLEKKYHIMEDFYRQNKAKISKILLDAYLRKMDGKGLNESRINGQMQALWRDWLSKEGHGIKTKSAEEEGRTSFIDTGNYMRFLHFEIED